jgi:hypothetical protein
MRTTFRSKAQLLGLLAIVTAGGMLGYWLSRPAPLPGGNPQRRALLVGVTAYDHLDSAGHLAGPGNDVRLLRDLLIRRFDFPTGNIVCLTEAEQQPHLRPTRANIEREFRRLTEQVRPGDQVVVLLAGHGGFPEPDGIDEIFLPADVRPWKDLSQKVPSAITDNEIGRCLRAVTARQADVWAIFDCCHSGHMTRGSEVVRELPSGILVPEEELTRARERAVQRGPRTRNNPTGKRPGFLDLGDDRLVALYACQPHETTPECPLPADDPEARYHGLLTYTVCEVLNQTVTPLTYRELTQRIQLRYARRPQGSPTPLIEGEGQDREGRRASATPTGRVCRHLRQPARFDGREHPGGLSPDRF